jgi:hypothetical protein
VNSALGWLFVARATHYVDVEAMKERLTPQYRAEASKQSRDTTAEDILSITPENLVL